MHYSFRTVQFHFRDEEIEGGGVTSSDPLSLIEEYNLKIIENFGGYVILVLCKFFYKGSFGKLLLKDTTLSIGEIAEKCGFENQYYFSKKFKVFRTFLFNY